MFKIENSKFYAEIMESVVKYFGMDAENVTEAEVHQKVVESETVGAMEARLTAAATAAVQTQIDALQTKLDALDAKFTALEAEATKSKSDLEAANGKVTTLEAEAAKSKADLEAANGKVTTLAGEVATLKAGKPVGGVQGAEDGLPLEESGTKFGTEIKATDLAARLQGKK